LGPLGVPETIFIFVLALLIFGPKKLPELGRTIGKAMTEFRRASSELKSTFDREMNAIEREADLKDVSPTATASSSYDYSGETYNYDNYYDSGAYGTESNESTAQTSTEGASATQGADTKADETANGYTTVADSSEMQEPEPPTGTVPRSDSQPVKS
jgi:TatA/E family protein of Tat protein translocase